MPKDGSSVRIRAAVRDQLKLIARQLSDQREDRVTMTSLLEDGIDEVLQQPLAVWVRWASEGEAPMSTGESVPFRIDSDRNKHLGLLAAEIQVQSGVPVTIVQLIEEAAHRIIALIEQEQAEMREMEALASE